MIVVLNPSIAASPIPRRGVGIRNAAARLEDVLEIGLQLPAADDLEWSLTSNSVSRDRTG